MRKAAEQSGTASAPTNAPNAKPPEHLLKLEGVVKRFRSGRCTVEALKGVNLAVGKGEE